MKQLFFGDCRMKTIKTELCNKFSWVSSSDVFSCEEVHVFGTIEIMIGLKTEKHFCSNVSGFLFREKPDPYVIGRFFIFLDQIQCGRAQSEQTSDACNVKYLSCFFEWEQGSKLSLPLNCCSKKTPILHSTVMTDILIWMTEILCETQKWH